jgi:hypothetical protein
MGLIMTRRDWVKKISALCLLSGFFSYEKFSAYFSPGMLTIEILFPDEKSIHHYREDRSKWIQAESVDKKIQDLIQKQELLGMHREWDEPQKTLVLKYEFKSYEAARSYVDFVRGSAGVRRDIRSNLGYQVKYKIT